MSALGSYSPLPTNNAHFTRRSTRLGLFTFVTWLPPRFKKAALLAFVLVSLFYILLWTWTWHYWLVNFATYSLRPLYDTPSIPQLVTNHIHAPGVPQDDLAACRRHGWDLWRPDKPGKQRKLVDAVIFSVELDLLEIRLAELYPVTSSFFILESTNTFTGLPKPLVLEPLLHPNSTDQRFRPYLDKIQYRGVRGRKLLQGEDPFNIEREMRWLMGDWLKSDEAGLDDGDLVIMSDVVRIVTRPACT
ncbi:hypothetical protein FRC04_006230 [Tulasnella sp. 424]|nr:hypothetical protein FRC04_006230 [Tulasnella sp. 424]